MKVFKIILKIFIVLVFIFGILLNVLLFGSSYNSLMFKYNEPLLQSFSASASNVLSKNVLSVKKNYGVQYETNSVNNCDTFVATYYWDKESNPTFSTECTYVESGTTKTNYTHFIAGVLYKDINGVKTKQTITFDRAISSYASLFKDSSVIQIDDSISYNNEDAKTSIHFSFSPFYFMGVRFTSKKDMSSYRYDYDLSGRLRTIVITAQNGEKKEYRYDYKKTKIDFPNFDSYQ